MTHLLPFFAITASVLLAQTNSGHGGGSAGISANSHPWAIQRSEPEYTKEALDAKLEGYVVLAATITVDGAAAEISVVKGLGLGLNEKAIECLQRWRFTPAMRNGERTPVKARVEIRFKLPASN